LAIATAVGGGAVTRLTSTPTAASPSATSQETGADHAKGAAHKNGRHRGRGLVRPLIHDTAKRTNQTRDHIVDQLKAGKTLKEIAGSQAGAVKQDVLDRAKQHLDKAVAAGKLTQADEQKRLDALSTRIDTVMAKNLSDRFTHPDRAKAPKSSPASASPAAFASDAGDDASAL